MRIREKKSQVISLVSLILISHSHLSSQISISSRIEFQFHKILKKLKTNWNCLPKMSENSLGIPGINAPTTSKPRGKSEMGRNKVLLKPGKGLLDWIRLSNAGRMTPHPPAKSVDHLELSRHNTENDCWILLFDTVYDVTQYLEFHPGGIPQLMRAAGTDGTNLFNEYHQWVNYKNMLKSCVIGPFTGAKDKLQPPKDPPPTEIKDRNITSSNSN